MCRCVVSVLPLKAALLKGLTVSMCSAGVKILRVGVTASSPVNTEGVPCRSKNNQTLNSGNKCSK